MRKYQFSKEAKQEFRNKMIEIEKFCKENDIKSSLSNDSYYFQINNDRYRVSNHSVRQSDKGMYNEHFVKIRDSYHNDPDEIQILASKTRIIEIYNDLVNGYELDYRGRRI